MNPIPLISCRQHYFYVLVFSLAAWLFIAMLVGGFVPVKYKNMDWCECRLHFKYMNISFFIYGVGGIVFGLLFSYPFHRLMIVKYTQPGDKQVPSSWMAKIGRRLLSWRGPAILLLISGIYLGADRLTHACFRTHPTYALLRIIHCAAARGDIIVIQSEINKGIDVDAEIKGGGTPMLMAAWKGQKGAITLLIEKGADVNAKTQDGYTPLLAAIIFGCKDSVALLIEKGADPNTMEIHNGFTPLHWAVHKSNMQIARLLIENGADMNIKNNTGNTPLDMASSAEIKLLLRSYGARTSAELKAEKKKK
ncbi:MAG: ankyrin repeat domain-containing protein [Planctomycetota bacterium]|nr:MAG: ankyrin repeat domain-containing protein [Planctomycetota bacterium]